MNVKFPPEKNYRCGTILRVLISDV